ncbi:MAG: short-chain dehydrogenase/reductase [Gammaproteobacteria bacterium]|jgi:NADP-dependent 3-hydroxy acid dehydrogenase YdfG|nr:short-chain dehydrogenase/reductase [Gammaproteobacteria bacterium]
MSKPLIIITGASSGIGEATAKKFAEQNYPLLLLARRIERLQALDLPNTLCAQVDVTDLAAFKAAITKAEAQFGPADCLINNAGVMLLGQIDSQDPAEWQQMLNVNVMGVLNGIATVLGGMIKRQQGTIINISSIAGRKTFPNHAAYCATKFAVHALTENIREETANHDVRLITIAPGVVETELLGHTTADKIKADYTDWKQQMGQPLQANDIAETIWFAYQQPQRVCIREIVIGPTRQTA